MQEASFKTKKMSPNLGFDRYGGHLVLTVTQTERSKRNSKYSRKRRTSTSTKWLYMSKKVFFTAYLPEPGLGLIVKWLYRNLKFCFMLKFWCNLDDDRQFVSNAIEIWLMFFLLYIFQKNKFQWNRFVFNMFFTLTCKFILRGIIVHSL